VNIGWLGKNESFQVGDVPAVFLTGLFFLCDKAKVNTTRGWHQCELCERKPEVPIAEALEGQTAYLGGAEIRVKDAEGRIFAAPDLIFHYVRSHSYKPPQEFIDAVIEQTSEPRAAGGHSLRSCP
jgi:hypothetical protein